MSWVFLFIRRSWMTMAILLKDWRFVNVYLARLSKRWQLWDSNPSPRRERPERGALDHSAKLFVGQVPVIIFRIKNKRLIGWKPCKSFQFSSFRFSSTFQRKNWSKKTHVWVKASRYYEFALRGIQVTYFGLKLCLARKFRVETYSVWV